MIPLNNVNSNNSKETSKTSKQIINPNMMNVEYLFEVIFEKFSKGLRLIGPLFAFALTLFVLIVARSAFFVLIPYWTASYGVLVGTILFLMAIYILFSILFNYFLCVLVRPGCLEDIKRSKYYRKNDPLYMKDDVVNLNDVFINNINKSAESNSNVLQNEIKHIKLRLKSDKKSLVADNINKEEEILKNANSKNYIEKFNLNNEISLQGAEFYSNNFDEESEIFKKHLETQLGQEESTANIQLELTQNLDKIASNVKIDKINEENYMQIEEINTQYNLNSENDKLHESNNSNEQEEIYSIRDCRYCKQPKPLRSHHCSICGYCVFKMDHHCPWVNNCVGQNNHRYFMLFLTHLMFGSLYVCITAIPLVFDTNIIRSTEFNFVCTLSLVGFFFMIFFNSWNWFLVLRGNTTIEFWTLKANANYNNPIKDFSMPTWRENFFLVFGTTSLFKGIFIPSIKKLPLSGLEWTKLAYPSFNFQIIEFERVEDVKITEINCQI